jgi:thiol:disulfide interchange protein
MRYLEFWAKRVSILLLCIAGVNPAFASRLNPVSWALQAQPQMAAPGSTIVLRLHAQIEEGYHLYSFTTPAGGPIKTTASLQSGPDFKAVGTYQATPDRHVDPNLNVPVETFANGVDFLVRTAIGADASSGEKMLAVKVRYQACSNEICLPPATRIATTSVQVGAGAPTTAEIPPGYHLVNGASGAVKARPAPATLSQVDWRFMLLAFGFGLATLFTPCVFPMIPLILSFFIGTQNRPRGRGVQSAALFSGSIILLFLAVGLGVTAVAGPFGVVRLAGSPWVNGFIALVFCILGVSLLGGFELALPSSILTRADQTSHGNALAVPGFLAFTFCLTSFACIGPFMGTLLAASIGTAAWAPALGMLAFAVGLAMPFFFLALFPSHLRKLPRSGPWLEQTKTVAGFLVLAAMFKYLANVDEVLHWGLITRERVLAAWFVLLLAAALYLLGQLRWSTGETRTELSLGRTLAGIAVLAFAVSLLPGLWGRKLGDLEAFLPLDQQNAASPEASVASDAGPTWRKDDYNAALREAQLEGKPLLIAFSGYSCTNCHWMKANIFPTPVVSATLEKYVLVELYTDGTDAASERNQKLEQEKFSTLALPYYAIVDGDGHELAHQDGLTRDANQFAAFLKKAWQARRQ